MIHEWTIWKPWVYKVPMENTEFRIGENLYMKIPSLESESSSLKTRRHFSLIFALVIHLNKKKGQNPGGKNNLQRIYYCLAVKGD